MKDVQTSVLENERIAEDVFRLRFPVDWPSYDPGQFVMLSVPSGVVFLRRPFSIADLGNGSAEVCYKVVGRGTKALSGAVCGTSINVLGPCGNSFDLSKGAPKVSSVLVAGGYGVAPLFGLAKRLKEYGKGVRLYFGGKDKNSLFYLKEFAGLGVDVRISTEDGSIGERGLISDLFERDKDSLRDAIVFGCGPIGLVKRVVKLCKSMGLPAQVSLEGHMACGIGVCLGCVCRNSSGEYVRICREGPVFDIEALRWE